MPKMYEYFLDQDMTPMKISSDLVTVEGKIINQDEGSGENGIYMWEIPAEFVDKILRVSIPDSRRARER